MVGVQSCKYVYEKPFEKDIIFKSCEDPWCFAYYKYVWECCQAIQTNII